MFQSSPPHGRATATSSTGRQGEPRLPPRGRPPRPRGGSGRRPRRRACAAGLARRTVSDTSPPVRRLSRPSPTAPARASGRRPRRRATSSPAEHPLTTLARLEVALWRSVERYRWRRPPRDPPRAPRARRPAHRRRASRPHGARSRAAWPRGAARGDAVRGRGAPGPAAPLTRFDAVVERALAPGTRRARHRRHRARRRRAPTRPWSTSTSSRPTDDARGALVTSHLWRRSQSASTPGRCHCSSP